MKERKVAIPVNPAVKAAVDKVVAAGFNLHALINQAKKDMKMQKVHFPDEVILNVCDSYWLYRHGIRRAYPWFLFVLKQEWSQFNARFNIEEHKKYKAEDFKAMRGGCAQISSILESIGVRDISMVVK